MEHDQGHKANGAGYEVEDASIREVVFTGIGLAVGTIIVCLAVFGLLKVMNVTASKSTHRLMQIPTAQSFPPEPRLQERPWEELQNIRKREEDVLTTYGWVNKPAGTVRIPIDRAMDVVVQRGLPVRSSGEAAGTVRPKTGAPEGNVPSQATGVGNAPQR